MSLQSMRVFSTEFKEAAVRRLEAGEALAAVARELEIARKLLYEWRAAHRAQGVGGLNRKRGRKPGQQRAPEGLAVKPLPEPPGDLARAQARIAELERKIGRQQMELDFFRRALHLAGGKETRASTAPTSARSSKK